MYPIFTRLAFGCTALLTAAAPLAAQDAIPGPSFEEVISLRNAGGAAISPDGRSVAFEVRATEWEANRFDTEIWLAREGEEPFQLTRTADGSSSGARWSPDGRWIAFLADRGDKQQIFLIRAAGGEARPLTAHEPGIGRFAWAPDSRRIAFSAEEPEPAQAKDRRKRFGSFEVDDAEYRVSHLWLMDAEAATAAVPGDAPCPLPPPAATPADSAGGPITPPDTAWPGPAAGCKSLPDPARLTEGDSMSISDFAWSPDGAQIAFSHRRDPLINSSTTSDISVTEVGTGAVRPLVRAPGSDGGVVWAPDGNSIVFQSAGGDTISNFYRNGQLLRIPAGGGEAVRLAAGFDEEIGGIEWTPAGLFGIAWQGAAARRLVRIDPASGAVQIIGGGPEIISGASFAADGRTVAFSGQTAATLSEIYRSPVGRFRPVALTRMSDQIRGWPVGTAELVQWQSTDGATIEGVLHKPADFDPGRKYPLLVVIHGGPTGIDYPTPVPGYVYPIVEWLAKGALVLRPNYRGSAGYGEAFRSLNVRNLGVGDAWDVLSGVDHLVAQGFVDDTRLGAMGWSQGGYISAFLATTSKRFRAISVGAGISNWMTYYVNTDIHPFTRQYLEATPWQDPEIYAKTSPITYISQAATPTLIQHGEFDRRVPIANAYELLQGLRDHGVPAKLIVYNGFGHGITKPKERLAAMWHNWQWFGEHLWGEKTEMPLQ